MAMREGMHPTLERVRGCWTTEAQEACSPFACSGHYYRVEAVAGVAGLAVPVEIVWRVRIGVGRVVFH